MVERKSILIDMQENYIHRSSKGLIKYCASNVQAMQTKIYLQIRC